MYVKIRPFCCVRSVPRGWVSCYARGQLSSIISVDDGTKVRLCADSVGQEDTLRLHPDVTTPGKAVCALYSLRVPKEPLDTAKAPAISELG